METETPKVMKIQAPAEESYIFSLWLVEAEVFTGKLPWEDKDFKGAIEFISHKMKECENSNEKNPVINLGQFPTFIQRLPRAG